MRPERELRFEPKMTDAEAMMWNLEKDPWLGSNIATISVLDQPLDFDLFRRKIAAAVAAVPRLRERVQPVLGRFAPPSWEPDPEFRLDHHLRRIALAEPGTERELLDLACTLVEDPFDRTRPLWEFVAIEGVQGGRAALLAKLHHTITDGEGGVRLSERYMDDGRDPPPPPDVDTTFPVERRTRSDAAPLAAATHILRRTLGIAKRAAGEIALAAVDPVRVAEGVRSAAGALSSAVSQLSETTAGSPLWGRRSRHRRLEVLTVPFQPAREAGRALGGSLNDFFVTGATMGAVRYHDKLGASADRFNVTFVVSTREDGSAGGNAFTPSKVQVPATPMSPSERFAAISAALAARRSEVSGGGLMASLAGIANLLPTSVVTGIARSQAASVDFATSNVRAAPFDLYVAGAKVLACYPMGPVAGTAWNITLVSYAGTLFMGVTVDPEAVEDPALLRDCLEDAFSDLIAAGGGA